VVFAAPLLPSLVTIFASDDPAGPGTFDPKSGSCDRTQVPEVMDTERDERGSGAKTDSPIG
jgi:hypothetical protein